MTSIFHASAIARTSANAADGAIEIAFVDLRGRSQTLTLTPETAANLASVLAEYAALANSSTAMPTKLPKSFAVGTGRHEPVVLVRFEDDIPYGLDHNRALELGHALIEQSQFVADRPQKALQ